MANKPLTMLQIRRILQLKSQGKSNRVIALELHLSRDSVNGYVKQLMLVDKSIDTLLKYNDEELSSLFHKEIALLKTDWRLTDLQQRIPGWSSDQGSRAGMILALSLHHFPSIPERKENANHETTNKRAQIRGSVTQVEFR